MYCRQFTAAIFIISALMMGTPASGQSASNGSQGYMNAMKKMQAEMPKDQTGDPDLDFARHMIPHHQGAADMAKVEVANGKDPELKKMARKIIKDQAKEIAKMQAWLKKHGK